MYFDIPGTVYDVYECLTYADGCTGSYEEDLWYGFPTPGATLPQSCANQNCETDGWRGAILPGHGLKLDTREKAWKVIDAGLSSAGIATDINQAEYYWIHRDDLPSGIGRDVYLIIVPVPGPVSGSTSTTRYFCMETEQLSGVDRLGSVHVKKGRGQQLRFQYTAGTENRKGTIWLKP
jgi:hypothetical protein